MKKLWKALCLFLCLGAVLSCLPIPARAIEHIDLSRTGTLNVTSRYGETPMEGASFRLYKIALPDVQCNLTPLPPFDQVAGDLNHLDQAGWEALAQELLVFVDQQGLTPMRTGETDETGRLRFADLDLALYLLVSDWHTQDTVQYQQQPILVMVPGRNQDDPDTWDYSVSVTNKPVTAKTALKVLKFWEDRENAGGKRPKSITIWLCRDGEDYEKITLPVDGKWEYTWQDLPHGHTWTVREEPIPNYAEGKPQRDDKDTTQIVYTITNTYQPPDPGKLPQTGQLWWPIPVLLMGGLLLVVVGLIRRRGDEA